METTDRIAVRPVRRDDVPELCALINEIIRIGGTTAYEQPMSEADFLEHYLTGRDCLTCFVAVTPQGGLLGFQALGRYPGLPDDWADIATFARAEPKVPGVGTALFAATRARAADLGFVAIHAIIRADNVGGLAYYAKMGFDEHAVARGVPLQDGTPVDRISKRYLVR